MTKDPTRGFNAETRWHRISEVVVTIENELNRLIHHELERLRQTEPDLFSKSIAGEDGYVTSVLLGALDRGVLVAVGLAFKASQGADGHIDIKTSRLACPGDCPSGVFTFFLDERRPIDDSSRLTGKT